MHEKVNLASLFLMRTINFFADVMFQEIKDVKEKNRKYKKEVVMLEKVIAMFLVLF